MLSLFRKKPTYDSVSAMAADAIEKAIVLGYYYNQVNRFPRTPHSHWMCICLHDMYQDKLITRNELEEVTRVIMRRLKGHQTLRGYLHTRGVYDFTMCHFEERIVFSNFWWQFIRELRDQPQLSESND